MDWACWRSSTCVAVTWAAHRADTWASRMYPDSRTARWTRRRRRSSSFRCSAASELAFRWASIFSRVSSCLFLAPRFTAFCSCWMAALILAEFSGSACSLPRSCVAGGGVDLRDGPCAGQAGVGLQGRVAVAGVIFGYLQSAAVGLRLLLGVFDHLRQAFGLLLRVIGQSRLRAPLGAARLGPAVL